MIRNLKVLGLSVVAVFAMSAIAASATSAYWFKPDAAAGVTTTLKGEMKARGEGSVDEFAFTLGIMQCNAAAYTGSAVGPTQTQMTVHPEYSGCTGFFSTTFITTGCNYVFKMTATNFVATMEIECTAGTEMTIVTKLASIPKCTFHIPPQDMGLVTLTSATKGSGVKDVHVHFNQTISYSETKGEGAGACASTVGNVGGGSYVGSATLSGFNAGGGETNIFLG